MRSSRPPTRNSSRTVEELETTNEELQSTNEELETMNEELQSTNEELQAINGELRDRTIEITDLNGFMGSILGSLEAAVIVLDRDLGVQVWTRRAHELWGLRVEETVARLLNLDSGLPTAELHPWLRSVITGQQTAIVGRQCERCESARPGKVELRVTVTSLQSDGDEPAGALILMEDISERR